MPEAPPPPAWVELKPSPGGWLPTDEALAGELLAQLGVDGMLLERDPPTPEVDGYYALHPSDDSAAVFLKVLSGRRAQSLQVADELVRYLAARGVRVSSMLPGFPRHLSNGHIVFGYPLLEYRFSTPTPRDMQGIGRLLAELHLHLRQFPGAHSIRRRSARMDSKIGAILDDLSDKQTAIVPSALRSFPYTYPEEDAQPIHGDLNYGNIIFDQTGEPVPIDFENCLHSWCTVGVDLAWVIERHILVHTQEDSLCLELCGVLLRNYLRFADSAPQELNLAALLTTKVLRPLLLLSGSPRITTEIQKFHFLYREIQRREELIEAIDRLYRRMRSEAGGI